MIAAQYGTVFTVDNYNKVNNVYSMWLCTNPPVNRNNTITCYEISKCNLIGNIHEKSSKYDILTVVMICTAEDTSQTDHPLLKLLSLIFNQGHSAKELENKLSTDYVIKVTPDLKERMITTCNLSYGVDQRGYKRGYPQRDEQCAIDMFTEHEPCDKIVRYSGLTLERVHEIGVAGGFIKE